MGLRALWPAMRRLLEERLRRPKGHFEAFLDTPSPRAVLAARRVTYPDPPKITPQEGPFISTGLGEDVTSRQFGEEKIKVVLGFGDGSRLALTHGHPLTGQFVKAADRMLKRRKGRGGQQGTLV